MGEWAYLFEYRAQIRDDFVGADGQEAVHELVGLDIREAVELETLGVIPRRVEVIGSL